MINEAVDGETCRFCGTQEGFRVFIFDKGSDHLKKIKCVLPLEVSEADGLPKFMCYRCTYRLKETFAFQQQCIKTDAMLRSKLGLQKSSDLVTSGHDLDAVKEASSSTPSPSPTGKLPGRISPGKNRSPGIVKKGSIHKRKSLKLHEGVVKDGVAGVVNGKAGHRGAAPGAKSAEAPAGGGADLPSTIVVTRIPGSCSIYTCQTCERCFVSEGAARNHGCEAREDSPLPAAVEEVEEEGDPTAGQPGAETREYFCEHCSKRFTRYVSLLAHQEAHLRCFAEEELEEFEKYQEEIISLTQDSAPLPPLPPKDSSLEAAAENLQPAPSEGATPQTLPPPSV